MVLIGAAGRTTTRPAAATQASLMAATQRMNWFNPYAIKATATCTSIPAGLTLIKVSNWSTRLSQRNTISMVQR